MPVLRDNAGNWIFDRRNQCPGRQVRPNAEMKRAKARWQQGLSGRK
jgi:hypothetical protein